MKYCSNCGASVNENQDVCFSCGKLVKVEPSSSVQNKKNSTDDTGGFLWGLLGFCIPIAGLVIFILWKDEKPKNSKAAIIGAAISFALGILGFIIQVLMFPMIA